MAAAARGARAAGYVWAAPLTLVGALLALVRSPKAWEWRDGHLAVHATPLGGFAGQAFGWAVLYRDGWRGSSPVLRHHEAAHVRQALVLGPLFPLVYGALWLAHFAVPPTEPEGRPRWFRAYYRVWLERKARSAARRAI